MDYTRVSTAGHHSSRHDRYREKHHKHHKPRRHHRKVSPEDDDDLERTTSFDGYGAPSSSFALTRKQRVLIIGLAIIVFVIVTAVALTLSGGGGGSSKKDISSPTAQPTEDISGGSDPDVVPTIAPTAPPTAPPTDPPTGPPVQRPTPPPIVLGRDPRIPYDKVVTSGGHDPFKGVPERMEADGVVFDYRPENLDILDAETRLSGEVPMGEFIRGRVVKDGQPLIKYYPGNLPFLFICIHTLDLELQPWMKNWPPSRRSCGSSKCDNLGAWKNFQKVSDDVIKKSPNKARNEMFKGIKNKFSLPFGDRSGPACMKTFEYIGKATGNYPHLIYSYVPKGFIDFNRQPGAKYLQIAGTMAKAGMKHMNPETWATYHDFFQFVSEAKNVIARQWGGGWNVNFHSMAGSQIGIGLGINWKNNMEKVYKQGYPGKTLKEMTGKETNAGLAAGDYINNRGMTPYESMYGPNALGEQLALRGIGGAPSRAFGWPIDQKNEKCYCGNTAFENLMRPQTSAWAKKENAEVRPWESIKNRPFESFYPDGAAFNTAIAEMYVRFCDVKREKGNVIKETVAGIGESVIDICNDVYNCGLERKPGHVNPYKSGRHIWTVAKEQTDCNEKTLKVIKHNFYIPLHKCVDACKETTGCKHFVMDTHGAHKTDRHCKLYGECAKTKKARWHMMYNLEEYESEK